MSLTGYILLRSGIKTLISLRSCALLRVGLIRGVLAVSGGALIYWPSAAYVAVRLKLHLRDRLVLENELQP